jgi:hypothetical protein
MLKNTSLLVAAVGLLAILSHMPSADAGVISSCFGWLCRKTAATPPGTHSNPQNENLKQSYESLPGITPRLPLNANLKQSYESLPGTHSNPQNANLKQSYESLPGITPKLPLNGNTLSQPFMPPANPSSNGIVNSIYIYI